MAYSLHRQRHPEADVANCKQDDRGEDFWTGGWNCKGDADGRIRHTDPRRALKQRELRRPYGAKCSGCPSWESPEVIPDCSIGNKSPSAAVAKVSCPGGLKP